MSGEESFKEDEELKYIREKKLKELYKRASGSSAPVGIAALNEESFDDFVSRSSTPVLVDFFAVWCPPCRMMEPVMKRLAEEFAGRIAFGKVNVDENTELALRFDVTAVPTFILFKNGKILVRIIGARDYESFKEILVKALKN